jgi:hypothetical protein
MLRASHLASWFCLGVAAVAQSPNPATQPPVGNRQLLGTQDPNLLNPNQQAQNPQNQPLSPYSSSSDLRALRDRLNSTWSRPLQQPQFVGFPTFTSALSGAYPLPGGLPGALPPGFELPVLPGAAAPTGWPSWARAASKEPLPNAPELALLVRHSDRVWRRERPEDAFTPLFYFEKLDGLVAGAEISVRQRGEFELLFYDTGRLVASGRTDLRLGAMDEKQVVVHVDTLWNLRLEGAGRSHEFLLPDGSSLLIPADPEEGPPPPRAVLTLAPIQAPGAERTRYSVFHGGGRPVRVRTAGQEVVLEGGHRIELFVAKRRHHGPTSPELLAEQALVVRDGDALVAEGAEAAGVHWLGASFRPAAGSRLRIDPIQGKPFADPDDSR